MKDKRILVGFSGGYASGVAAFLLSRQDYDVLGVYLKLAGTSIEEEMKAQELAHKFDIPFRVIDLGAEEYAGLEGFEEATFAEENPNYEYHYNQFILSNLKKIADELNIEYIGTGHILKKKYMLKEKRYALFSTTHWEKMQTHLAAGIDLERFIMPLGDIPHQDISKICKELGIDYKHFQKSEEEKIIVHNDFVEDGKEGFRIVLKNTEYYRDNYHAFDSFIYINRTHEVVRGIAHFKKFYQALLKTKNPLELKDGEEIFVFENTSADNKRLVGFGNVAFTKTIDLENLEGEKHETKNTYESF